MSKTRAITVTIELFYLDIDFENEMFGQLGPMDFDTAVETAELMKEAEGYYSDFWPAISAIAIVERTEFDEDANNGANILWPINPNFSVVRNRVLHNNLRREHLMKIN